MRVEESTTNQQVSLDESIFAEDNNTLQTYVQKVFNYHDVPYRQYNHLIDQKVDGLHYISDHHGIFEIDKFKNAIFKEVNAEERFKNYLCISKKIKSLGLKYITVPKSKLLSITISDKTVYILAQERLPIVDFKEECPEIVDICVKNMDKEQLESIANKIKPIFRRIMEGIPNQSYEELVDILIHHPFSNDLRIFDSVAILKEQSKQRKTDGAVFAFIDLKDAYNNSCEEKQRIYEVLCNLVFFHINKFVLWEKIKENAQFKNGHLSLQDCKNVYTSLSSNCIDANLKKKSTSISGNMLAVFIVYHAFIKELHHVLQELQEVKNQLQDIKNLSRGIDRWSMGT